MVPMKLIIKKRARMLCFERRKKGLKKAAYELSTLCGVDIGMVIYDRDSDDSEVCGSLERMIQLWESRTAQDRRCRAYGVADYINEEIEKAKKMRDKAGRDECGRLSLHQLQELGGFLDARIAAVRGRICFLKNQESGIFLNQDHYQQQNMFLGNPSFINAEAANHANHVFVNHQESGLFLNQDQQQTMFWGDSSLIKAGEANHVFLNQENGLCLNQDQQQTMFWGDSSLIEAEEANHVFLNPSLQESGFCLNQDQQQQQAMFWGNSSLMEDDIEQMLHRLC